MMLIHFLHPLGFIQLLNLPFLWAGLGLLSIPILIHILNRRRFKVVSWAAMDFLLRAMRQNRKRLKFEQWILLAARCLLIFLIAFALARPLVGCSRSSLAAQFGGRAGLNVFVIDNSYSTGYQANHAGGGKTHLDQEKLVARRLIDQLNSGGESVAIITAARPATAIIAKPGYDLNAARDAIDRIEPSYADTDLAGALQLAQQLGEEESHQPNKSLYLLTDGTRSAWEGAQADAIRRAGPGLAKLYHITHYNMTEGRQQWNQSVLAVRPASNLITTKFNSDVLADARGYGNGPEASLEWSLDGAHYGQSPLLKLEPSSQVQRQQILARDLKRGGPHLLTVAIKGGAAGDPLKADDTRSRVIDVAAELHVLIVEGKRGSTALEGSGAFLQMALAAPADNAPANAQQSGSYVAADLISDIDLSNKLLSDYKAVVLAGVGQITVPQADALQKFVSAGGTLMLFMGDAVTKENYNSVLLPRKLMPGPLIKEVDAGAGPGSKFDFKPNSVLHPFLHLFQNKENTGLDQVTTHTYWQVDIPPDSQVERVLNYLPASGKAGAASNGASLDPAITHHRLGEGHVIFISTTASPEWTDFPAKGVPFVEVMHEMLSGGIRSGDYWMNLIVGQPLEIPSTIKLNGSPDLRDDANTSIPLSPITVKDQTVYRSRPLSKPGVYTLNLGTLTVPVAVNVPPDEADVRTIGNEAVRKALGDVELSLQGDEVPSVAAADREGLDWAEPVLLLVLALLAVEGFMAMSFGHYRRAEVVRK